MKKKSFILLLTILLSSCSFDFSIGNITNSNSTVNNSLSNITSPIPSTNPNSTTTSSGIGTSSNLTSDTTSIITSVPTPTTPTPVTSTPTTTLTTPTPSTPETPSTPDTLEEPYITLKEYLGENYVVVPKFPEAQYAASIETDNGEYFLAYTEDNGTIGVNSLEDVYLTTVLSASSWTCINDEENTYEDYGYLYVNDAYDIELQFYTYEGYFSVYVYLYEDSGDEGGDQGGSVTGDYEVGTWDQDELALIEEYAYGVEIPCLRIPGNGDLYFDDEYGCLSMTGATADLEVLQAYAALFDEADWISYNDSTSTSFYFEKAVQVGGETRYIGASIYCLDVEGYYAESGTFWLDLYDPYYYEWPTELVGQIVTYYGSTATVPSYTASDLYYVDTSYIDWGSVSILCYTDDASSETTYENALKGLGYTVSYDSEWECYVAIAPTNDLEVDYIYDELSGGLCIYIYAYSGSGEGGDVGGDTPEQGGEGTGSTGSDQEGNLIATLDFTTLNDQQIFTTQTVGDVTFTSTKVNGNDDTKYFSNGSALRIYWGNSFSFSVPSGYEIVSVELERAEAKNTFDTLTWTNATATFDTTTCVATAGAGATNVSFSVTGTSGHIRLTSVSVTYRAL